MSCDEVAFNKEDMDMYLRELAKVFRKLNGKRCLLKLYLSAERRCLLTMAFAIPHTILMPL